MSTYISLRTRALSPAVAASALPRPPILAKHCASMQRSYTRSIAFNGCREGYRGPGVISTACPCPVQKKLIDLSSWPAQVVARCLIWMSKPVVLLSHAVYPSKGPYLLRHVPGASLSNVLASWVHTLDHLQRAELCKGPFSGKRLRYYALNMFSKDLGMGSRTGWWPAKSDFFDTKPSIWPNRFEALHCLEGTGSMALRHVSARFGTL